MRIYLIIAVLLGSSGFLLQAQTTDQADLKVSPFSIGEQITLFSPVLEEERILNIYLPQSYHPDSSNTYPVIYLLDGSADEDFIHTAGLVQFASFPWINMVPESIVVGIANKDRIGDFTYPTRETEAVEKYPTIGGSADFRQFIGQEVQPLIQQRYRTTGEPTLIGQSLGGLLASEILWKQPDLFGRYIIVSPSLWWDEESLLEKASWQLAGKQIFVAVGKEGEIMERVARELYDQLEANKTDSTQLYFDYLEKQDHANILHLAVYRVFEQLAAEQKEAEGE